MTQITEPYCTWFLQLKNSVRGGHALRLFASGGTPTQVVGGPNLDFNDAVVSFTKLYAR